MRKNIFTVIAIIFLVNSVSAQTTRLGFSAGPVAATMFSKVNEVKETGDYRFGATFGIFLDVPMQKIGSFQPGLNFVQKGMKTTTLQGNQTVEVKTHLDYIEMPFNIVFRVPMKNGKILLGTGAVPAIALNGKRLYDQPTNSRGKEDIKMGDNTDDEMNWVDFGINGIAGYEFNNGLILSATYNYGINRLYNGGNEDDKLYNRYFALRVAYLLKGKK